MGFRLDNYFLRAFVAAALLALFMLVQALGMIYLFRFGTPLSLPIILIMAALIFVLSASFFERYEVGSIIWSLLVSLIVTLLLILVSGGVVYFAWVTWPSWDEILSGLAVCIMISMTLLNYLKRSLGEIEH